MIIVPFEESVPCEYRQAVLAIGFFDGLHIGHRALLAFAGRLAASLGARLTLLCFDPHPSAVLRPEAPVPMIYDLRERAYVVEQERLADAMVAMHFTGELARTAPGDFLAGIKERWRPAAIVVGVDFRFGRENAGDSAALVKWGVNGGVAVKCFPEFRFKGERVSASRIRNVLQQGNLPEAGDLLGRPYFHLETGQWEPAEEGKAAFAFSFSPSKLHLPQGEYEVTVETGSVRSPAAAVIREERGILTGRILTRTPAHEHSVKTGVQDFNKIEFIKKL